MSFRAGKNIVETKLSNQIDVYVLKIAHLGYVYSNKVFRELAKLLGNIMQRTVFAVPKAKGHS